MAILCLISLSVLTLMGFSSGQLTPIDNGLVGDPELICGDGFIGLEIETENSFEGNVFVKDEYADPECRVRGTGTGNRARLDLQFMSCGVSRVRSANPRGVFVTVNVIVSFHSEFITKKDRAFMLQCYYMESEKTVMTELEVSMMTTQFQTMNIPMPICRYEVLSGGPSGPIVTFARIGDKVYHKWTCDTETMDVFCMIVHSCKVNDGFGDEIELIKTDGCATDSHLLGNLDYMTDLMAGKEAHVFKYADRARLFFDCQISIEVKEPGEICRRPECKDRRRFKRQVETSRIHVIAPNPPPISINRNRTNEKSNQNEIIVETKQEDKRPYFLEDLCMSTVSFSIYAAFNGILVVSSLALFGMTLFSGGSRSEEEIYPPYTMRPPVYHRY